MKTITKDELNFLEVTKLHIDCHKHGTQLGVVTFSSYVCCEECLKEYNENKEKNNSSSK
jgi:hypothetical protein